MTSTGKKIKGKCMVCGKITNEKNFYYASPDGYIAISGGFMHKKCRKVGYRPKLYEKN